MGLVPTCDGLGTKLDVDPDLIIPDPSLSIDEGAIQAWSDPSRRAPTAGRNPGPGYYEEILEDVCRRARIPSHKPWKDLSKDQQKMILHGGGQYKVHWARTTRILKASSLSSNAAITKANRNS